MSSKHKHGIVWFVLIGWWWYLLFAWWVAILRRAAKSGHVVTVAFRDLADPPRDGLGGGYTYTWPFRRRPEIGDRVFVPGMDPQPSPAVVISLTASPTSRGLDLKPVARLATDHEIEAAEKRKDADRAAWLNMARHVAGLPTTGRVRHSPPDGYPAIPPAAGHAAPTEADSYGRTWWRVYKTAERAGWAAPDIAVIRAVAHHWFAIRDKESSPRVPRDSIDT